MQNARKRGLSAISENFRDLNAKKKPVNRHKSQKRTHRGVSCNLGKVRTEGTKPRNNKKTIKGGPRDLCANSKKTRAK